MTWLPLALFALTVWSLQRVVTKAALLRWSTARFYRWNAIVSLLVYAPFVLFVPPVATALPSALGLSFLMALTFWVTTEATRRGPVGVVAPLTATSPAITVVLAVVVLGERPDLAAWVGVAAALAAAALLAWRPIASHVGGWLAFAVASLAMQGVGAFLAKVIVTGAGPSTLLITSVVVQLAVGVYIARSESLALRDHLSGMPLLVTLTLAAAALATVGYLSALSVGPATLIVPLVATSPVVGGLLGMVILRENSSPRQTVGIALGLVAIVLLARG